MRGLERRHPTGDTTHGNRLAVSDQRFKGLPIARRVAAGCLQQSEQTGRAAGVQSRQHPARSAVFQFDVVGAHQLTRGHVDQPVAENIGSQQHLTVAALEPSQVNLVVHQDYPVWLES